LAIEHRGWLKRKQTLLFSVKRFLRFMALVIDKTPHILLVLLGLSLLKCMNLLVTKWSWMNCSELLAKELLPMIPEKFCFFLFLSYRKFLDLPFKSQLFVFVFLWK